MIGRPRTLQPAAHLDGALWDAEHGTGLPLFRGFTGLWNHADREGRFEWKPRELKQVILPYWDGDMEDVLQALAGRGFIVRYEVDGRRYGTVRNFKKHQWINAKEPASTLPAPPKDIADGTGRQRAKSPGTGQGASGTGQTQLEAVVGDTPKTPHSSGGDPEAHRKNSGKPADSEGSPPTPPSPNLSLSPDFSSSLSASAEDLTGSAREDEESNEEPEKKSPFKSDEERVAFEHWARLVYGKAHPGKAPRATPKRVTPFRARLRDGAKADDFRVACENVSASPFHFGENETGALYIEPKTLFGNAEKLEGWMAKRAPKAKGAAPVSVFEREQDERDAKLLVEIREGLWGDKAKLWGTAKARDAGDMRRFREAIEAGKVKRVPTTVRRASRPPPQVQALLTGVGRPMR